jgi:hypothetical protein
VGGVATFHPIDQRLEQPVGAHSGRPRLHHLFDEPIVRSFQGRGSETTDHHPVTIDNRSYLPPVNALSGSYVDNGLIGSADDGIAACRFGDTFSPIRNSLEWESGSLPIGDPTDIVEHPGESQTFEPARGSW